MDLAILLLYVQLVESGPGRVSPGGSFKLMCKMMGDSIKKVYWEWIPYESPNEYYLTMRPLTAADSATYYCSHR
uniref:Ig-like domain-containing protein n=1 Tax=Naja naja TaxID=35670 RepID=A0A8C6X5L2_NAJNA